MKNVTVVSAPIPSGTLAYVADLYRAGTPLEEKDLAFLRLLPKFSVLMVKTIRSRTLDIFPPRPTPDMTLTAAGPNSWLAWVSGPLCQTTACSQIPPARFR